MTDHYTEAERLLAPRESAGAPGFVMPSQAEVEEATAHATLALCDRIDIVIALLKARIPAPAAYGFAPGPPMSREEADALLREIKTRSEGRPS